MIKIYINDVEVETDGNFKIGYTTHTDQTRTWTQEQLEKNNEHEACKIFANFYVEDQGKSRVLVAKCETSEQAINVLGALRSAILDTKFELAEIINQLVEVNDLAEQPDSMLQAAIDMFSKDGQYSHQRTEMQALLNARKILKEIEYEWMKENQ